MLPSFAIIQIRPRHLWSRDVFRTVDGAPTRMWILTHVLSDCQVATTPTKGRR